MDIITRKEARERGLKRYYTGKPCKHGHLSERRVDSGGCIECGKSEYKRQWREANKDKIAEYQRQWREANPDKKAEYERRYYQANKDKKSEYERQYREANPDKIAERQRRWREANRDKKAATQAKRRSAKLERTPAYADLGALEAFYALAKEMTEETGIPHHVDHIVPLQGDNVSGLHVSTNLQVIPAEDNLRKGNSYLGNL